MRLLSVGEVADPQAELFEIEGWDPVTLAMPEAVRDKQRKSI